jgi:hypothetical protein
MNPRSLAIAGTPVALAGLVFVGTGPVARADDASQNVTMSAQAVALQTVYQSLNVPFGLPFAVGSYGASADLDAGGATADAGAPYSPLISSLPAAGNGVASTQGYQLPVVPTFPGYVTARYPQRATELQDAGGYRLAATTGAAEAEGRVGMGGEREVSDRNNVFAIARTTAKDGTMAVDSQAGAVALTLPGILDLANSSSEVHVSRAAGDERPTYTSTTSLGTINFAGTTSGLTGDTFQVVGAKSTPINLDTLATINQALTPSGVSLSYLPSSFVYTDGTYSSGDQPTQGKTLRGLTSGALQILIHKDVQGQGPTTETITIGQISVSAQGEGVVAGSTAPATGSASSSTPAQGAPSTAAGTAALAEQALPLSPTTIGVTNPMASAPEPRSDTISLVQAEAPATAASPSERIRAALTRIERINFSTDDSYLLLFVVGGAMLAGSVVTRRLAVRLLTLRRR